MLRAQFLPHVNTLRIHYKDYWLSLGKQQLFTVRMT
jgi:hypothetical protein